MRSGLFTTMWHANSLGPDMMIHLKWYQKQTFIRLCSQYCGLLKVSFFELLPRNQTINSNVYSQQLGSLKESIIQKCPELVNHKVVFHHNNVRSHKFDHPSKIIGAWMGCCHTQYTHLILHHQFPLVLLYSKLLAWYNIQFRWGYKSAPYSVFCW